MKKALVITSWVLGAALLLGLMAFSGSKCATLKLEGLAIEIDYEKEHYFVTQNDVQKIIKNQYPYLDSLFCKEINIQLLEDELAKHPSIKRAEVFSAMDGILRIRVWQREPLLRVMQESTSFYIDESGGQMPLSQNYSASVPLVTGYFETQNDSVFQFFSALKADNFFQNFFTGLDIDSTGNWVLFPKPGRHKVLMGKPIHWDTKLVRLRKFYQTIATDQNLDSIASLSLAYDGQVICKKY